MFKRIRCFSGNTLRIECPVEGIVHTLSGTIKKGSGSPAARMTVKQTGPEIIATVSPEQTRNLSGTYKFDIIGTDGHGVKTLMYGIIEVM